MCYRALGSNNSKRLSARQRRRCGFCILRLQAASNRAPKRQPMRRSLVMAANLATTAAVRPTVIFLHGSGDTGRGVEGWLRSLALQDAGPLIGSFRRPNPSPYAPPRVQGSVVRRAGGFEPHHPEQTDTVERSAARILGAH